MPNNLGQQNVQVDFLISRILFSTIVPRDTFPAAWADHSKNELSTAIVVVGCCSHLPFTHAQWYSFRYYRLRWVWLHAPNLETINPSNPTQCNYPTLSWHREYHVRGSAGACGLSWQWLSDGRLTCCLLGIITLLWRHGIHFGRTSKWLPDERLRAAESTCKYANPIGRYYLNGHWDCD